MLKTLFVMMLCCLYPGLSHAQTQVRVLDVNEGQAVLLSAGNNGMLIDTGHAGEAENLLQKLSRYGVTELAFMVLTHLHPDHASGYFRIREAFPETPVLTACHPLPKNVSPDMTRWLYEALAEDPLHRCIGAGDEMHFSDMRIAVLWPQRFESHDLNHHSLVLQLSSEDTDILLMGDVNKTVERQLIEENLLPRQVDVLVAGHHGAADATSEALLRHVKPKRAVLSVNADNVRGYPAAQVIERLKAHNIPLKRTDVHQDVEL